MRELVIVGAGPHGREIVDIVDDLNTVASTWEFLGFVDDGDLVSSRGEKPRGAHLGPVAYLETHDVDYVLGIGRPEVRSRLDATLTGWSRTAAVLVHPSCTVGGDNRIDPGVVLAAGARVTTNVTLGRHVHLNVNAVVSHDCTVGSFTTIAPGAHLNGDVRVGERSYIGSGAIILPQVTIGNDVMIGAGAVVTKDVPDRTTAKGVPAIF